MGWGSIFWRDSEEAPRRAALSASKSLLLSASRARRAGAGGVSAGFPVFLLSAAGLSRQRCQLRKRLTRYRGRIGCCEPRRLADCVLLFAAAVGGATFSGSPPGSPASALAAMKPSKVLENDKSYKSVQGKKKWK